MVQLLGCTFTYQPFRMMELTYESDIRKQCLPSLEANPFLLKEEETYEPPEDPDSGTKYLFSLHMTHIDTF